MKKILQLSFLALSLFTLSCSSNDDTTTPQQNNPVTTQYFHPPLFIQGSWKISGSSSAYFKFSSDNFILVTPYTSWKSVLQQTASTGQIAKVNEQISDTYYEFTIIAGASSGQYKFKKISDTRIQWVGNTIPPVYLDKE
ncbi:hypothetical protein [Chryseobacterium bernardetii]|uniref:hypothetical protein n=1 Tax=Chryseobacterium bernardetii TaxID=1241978 RepID=UPI003AF5187E